MCVVMVLVLMGLVKFGYFVLLLNLLVDENRGLLEMMLM